MKKYDSANGVSWHAHVDMAIECERRYRAMSPQRAGKLSAKAFLSEALAIANCDKSRAIEVERMRSDPDFDAARALIDSVSRLYLEANMSEPVPSAQLARFARIYGREGSRAELAQAGVKLAEAFAAAALIATKAKPAAFGTIESRSEHATALKKLIAERERIFGIVENTFSAQDLVITAPASASLRDAGLTHTCFRRGGGVVAIGEGSGERLCAHLLDADAAKRAA